MDNEKILEAIPIREQVADILRRQIISGKLKEGEKLSERQISLELNVSTTPVKEALRLLHSEGLTYTLPRRGSYVAANISEHTYQMILLRSVIEGVAANLAARNLTEENYLLMKEPIEKAGELLKDGCTDSSMIGGYNEAFHSAIRECSGNRQIISIGNNIKAMENSVRQVVNRKSEILIQRQKEHEDILDAIYRRDAEEAERLVVRHVRTNNTIIKRF